MLRVRRSLGALLAGRLISPGGDAGAAIWCAALLAIHDAGGGTDVKIDHAIALYADHKTALSELSSAVVCRN